MGMEKETWEEKIRGMKKRLKFKRQDMRKRCRLHLDDTCRTKYK